MKNDATHLKCLKCDRPLKDQFALDLHAKVCTGTMTIVFPNTDKVATISEAIERSRLDA